MTLKQIRAALMASEFGAQLIDGMGISEPVPVLTEEGRGEAFFVFLANRLERTFTGPAARLLLCPEEKKLLSVTSHLEQPFSKGPEEVFEMQLSREARSAAYREYEEKYNAAQELFFTDCNEEEALRLREYLASLQKVTEPAQFPFYRELAPEFFAWLDEQLQQLNGCG